MLKRIAFALIACLWASVAFGQANGVSGIATGTGYPQGSTPIVVAASGSTGAVGTTILAAPGRFNYLCGFQVSSAGGTASSGPVAVTGIGGPSATQFTFQLPVNAAGVPVNFVQTYWPCLPATTANSNISLATTANATATAVDLQAWGYQLPAN
jgi:hypothetical protein